MNNGRGWDMIRETHYSSPQLKLLVYWRLRHIDACVHRLSTSRYNRMRAEVKSLYIGRTAVRRNCKIIIMYGVYLILNSGDRSLPAS
jgi:hypothetical protein